MRTNLAAIGIMLLAVVGFSATAGAATIGDIVTTPDAYDGKAVTVTGTVDRSMPVGSESAFDLRDGSARLTVLSRVAPPTVGDKLSVSGTVHVFHGGDGGPEENKFPAVLIESARAPAP